jgi:hypothetical protein
VSDEQTGTVVSYVRYADGTLLEVLTATPNESGRFGKKKWIHVVRVRPSSSSSSHDARARKDHDGPQRPGRGAYRAPKKKEEEIE